MKTIVTIIIFTFLLLSSCSSEPTPIPTATPNPTPTVSALFKIQGLKLVEEATKLKSMTTQGVNFVDYSAQLAEVNGIFELLKSLWGDDFELSTKENIVNAFQGWNLAHKLWDLKINYKYAITEYDDTKIYYDQIINYGGDNLVTVFSGKYLFDEELGEERNMKRLPYDENISILFSLANDYFDKAQPELMKIIQ